MGTEPELSAAASVNGVTVENGQIVTVSGGSWGLRSIWTECNGFGLFLRGRNGAVGECWGGRGIGSSSCVRLVVRRVSFPDEG